MSASKAEGRGFCSSDSALGPSFLRFGSVLPWGTRCRWFRARTHQAPLVSPPLPSMPCGSGFPSWGAEVSPLVVSCGILRGSEDSLPITTEGTHFCAPSHTQEAHPSHPLHTQIHPSPTCTQPTRSHSHPSAHIRDTHRYTHTFPPHTHTHTTCAHCTDTHHTQPCTSTGAHALQTPTTSHTRHTHTTH